MRLPARLRVSLYAAAVLVAASGIAWLAAHYSVDKPGLATLSMEIHGGAAMAFLVLAGAVAALHAPPAWNDGKNRGSGTTMLAAVLALMVTGYLLYYLGNEQARAVVSIVHWGTGLGAMAGLALHVWLGQRSARRD